MSNSTAAAEIAQPTSVVIDMDSPYYLYPFDNPGVNLVNDTFTGIDNYNSWFLAMSMALKGKNKFGFVDGSIPIPNTASPDFSRWTRVNNMVMSWLLNSIDRSLASTVLYAATTSMVWSDLKARFSSSNGPRIYELERHLATITQGSDLITQYFNKLRGNWDELAVIDPPPSCSCMECTCGAKDVYHSQLEKWRLMQFLMGLHELFQQTRSQLLLTSTLPTVSQAYSLLLQDGAQRQHQTLPSVQEHTTLQTSTLIPTSKYDPVAAASQTHMPRPGLSRNRPKCTHCGIIGHTQDVCYKLHGYPPGHKFYKKGNTHASPSTVAPPKPSGTTNPLTSESLKQLLSLLQEVNQPNANLSGKSLVLYSSLCSPQEWVIYTGATDHISHNQDLFSQPLLTSNTPSHLSVPNGDFVPVDGIGNITINSNITLFDVLYVPSFKFNLLSVRKLTQALNCVILFYPDHCVF